MKINKLTGIVVNFLNCENHFHLGIILYIYTWYIQVYVMSNIPSICMQYSSLITFTGTSLILATLLLVSMTILFQKSNRFYAAVLYKGPVRQRFINILCQVLKTTQMKTDLQDPQWESMRTWRLTAGCLWWSSWQSCFLQWTHHGQNPAPHRRSVACGHLGGYDYVTLMKLALQSVVGPSRMTSDWQEIVINRNIK